MQALKFKNLMQVVAIAIVVTLFAAQDCFAAGLRSRPPAEGYTNAWGLGLSYGQGISQDSSLWGWTTDYTRVVTDDGAWVFNASLAWDRDTQKMSSGDEVIDTYSVTVAVTYRIIGNLYVGTGLAKGLLERKIEPQRENWKWSKPGDDWSTGILASGPIWSKGRFGLASGATLEYNITANKWSWSVDLGFSMGF